jgi:hypothetical protein
VRHKLFSIKHFVKPRNYLRSIAEYCDLIFSQEELLIRARKSFFGGGTLVILGQTSKQPMNLHTTNDTALRGNIYKLDPFSRQPNHIHQPPNETRFEFKAKKFSRTPCAV